MKKINDNNVPEGFRLGGRKKEPSTISFDSILLSNKNPCASLCTHSLPGRKPHPWF